LVPTMGALHAGHLSLLEAARAKSDVVVASIFINPLQFRPGEDLARYPRSRELDLEMCAAAGVDVVFAPAVDVVYPGGEPQVLVEPGPLANVLEGAARPGHFRGVLTVVAKLFGLVQPDLACFGEKDYQQLVLVDQMVSDLCMPVDVIACGIARDPDGLALSSRNRYLSAAERVNALALSRALREGRLAGAAGAEGVLSAANAILDTAPGVDVDYLALTGTGLGDAPDSGAARLLVAATVGSTRLIDNTAVLLGAQP
ncbi:MAG: pantoate--beta-alanine ligase, partial [Nocardioidaceae bacterium]